MIGQPKFGWTHVTIGDFEAPASYLTDVPLEIIDALISGYRYGVDPAVTFDAEGYVYTVVVSNYWSKVYVILERDEEPELFVFDIAMNDFALEVLHDIEDDLDGWANFVFHDDKDETSKRREYLLTATGLLRSLIDANKR